MPIRPENKQRYPAEWPQIRERIRQRAGNRCEKCGLFNHAWGWRDPAGDFHQVAKHPIIQAKWRKGDKPVRPPFEMLIGRTLVSIIEIVCTVAHLDHQPENCEDDNLKFWCQRCHLAYDMPHHKTSRYMNARLLRGNMELPL